MKAHTKFNFVIQLVYSTNFVQFFLVFSRTPNFYRTLSSFCSTHTLCTQAKKEISQKKPKTKIAKTIFVIAHCGFCSQQLSNIFCVRHWRYLTIIERLHCRIHTILGTYNAESQEILFEQTIFLATDTVKPLIQIVM